MSSRNMNPLLQRIKQKKNGTKDSIMDINEENEVFEMKEGTRTEEKSPPDTVLEIPQPKPRRSILSQKSKTEAGGSVNLSFQPDDEIDKQEGSVHVEEQIENSKDNGQEVASELKDQVPTEVPPLALPTTNVHPNEAPKMNIRADEGYVMGMVIHQTDPLEIDYHIRHPMVRVHIIDYNIQNYLAKIDKNRPVSSFYETQHSRSDFVLPILTQQYSFADHKSLIPKWEETIIFNENFHYFSDPSVNTYIVFEILDYVSPSEMPQNIRYFGREAGWIKIAWAFLKIVGKNGAVNTGRRCRLQLYKMPRIPNRNSCEAFSWLNAKPRLKYPSTIYVTVKALQLPNQFLPSTRSMLATQGEVAVQSDDNFKKTLGLISAASGAPMLQSSVHGTQLLNNNVSGKGMVEWSRLPGQVCRLPNSQIDSFYTGQMGCTKLAFSNTGLYLAAAGVDPASCDYSITIYDVKSKNVNISLFGHINVVYDLNWSNDDTLLVSASSDATARIWTVEETSAQLSSDPTAQCQHIDLAHPSFVYSARFHPKVKSIVVTGCHDGKVRIFGIKSKSALILQEIHGPGGLVNCLEFDPAGHLLFSGSSTGIVVCWSCNVTAQPNHPHCGFTREWTLEKRVRAKEIEGIAINRIFRPQKSARLLVHTRDSSLRLYDLSTEVCTQLFTGHINARDFAGSCMTPCGTFVLAASEVGTVFVWNAVTGDVVTVYDNLPFSTGVSDVQFHPHDHIVAFCAYGESHQVLVFEFNESKARLDAEYLKRVERGESAGEHKVKLLEPDRIDIGKEISSINEQLTRNFTNRVDKVSKALTAVAPMPETPFKQNVVDALILGQQPTTTRIGPSASMMLTSTQFASQPVINFKITDGDKVETEVKAPASTKRTNERFVALYDYEPQRADELSLRKGDIILVLCRESERWWLGENSTVGAEDRGYFPANYVTPAEEQKRKTTRTRKFKSRNADSQKSINLFTLEPPTTSRSVSSIAQP